MTIALLVLTGFNSIGIGTLIWKSSATVPNIDNEPTNDSITISSDTEGLA